MDAEQFPPRVSKILTPECCFMSSLNMLTTSNKGLTAGCRNLATKRKDPNLNDTCIEPSRHYINDSLVSHSKVDMPSRPPSQEHASDDSPPGYQVNSVQDQK